MAHPANAAYVSGDGKVSFDQWGRKLDSLGNVAWGDRQTVQGAGGRPIERPQPQQQQPAQQQGYNPLSGGSANTGVPARTGSAMAPAPAPAGQRPIPPGVLAPGGIDPATGRKVQTYYNTVMSPAGDDYALRNPQPQLPTQQWRPAGQGPLTQRPPSPSAGDVGMPSKLAPSNAYPLPRIAPIGGQKTGPAADIPPVQMGATYAWRKGDGTVWGVPFPAPWSDLVGYFPFGDGPTMTIPQPTGPRIDGQGNLIFVPRVVNPSPPTQPTFNAQGVPRGYDLGGDPSSAYYSGFGIRP